MRPQFGSAPCNGRLHQRAVGHGLGDLQGRLAVGAAADFDGDQVRGPFAVAGDRLGQIDAHFVQGRLERGQIVAGQRLAAGRAVGQQQHRVVGAHVAVDAHAVEAVVGRGAQSAAWAAAGVERRRRS